jgi:hypothetical protein
VNSLQSNYFYTQELRIEPLSLVEGAQNSYHFDQFIVSQKIQWNQNENQNISINYTTNKMQWNQNEVNMLAYNIVLYFIITLTNFSHG